MTKALDGLVELLDLETIEVDVVRGLSPDDDRRRTAQPFAREPGRSLLRPLAR